MLISRTTRCVFFFLSHSFRIYFIWSCFILIHFSALCPQAAQRRIQAQGDTVSAPSTLKFSYFLQANVRNYYMQFEEKTTQTMLENKLRSFTSDAASAYQLQLRVARSIQLQVGRAENETDHVGASWTLLYLSAEHSLLVSSCVS